MQILSGMLLENSGKIYWPRIEKFILILIALSIPLSIAVTNVALGLGTILLIRKMIVSHDTALRWTKGITIALLVYLFFDLTATLFSGFPVDVKGFIEDKWVISCYFITLGLLDDVKTISHLLIALVISSAVAAYYSILQFVIGWDFIRWEILEPMGNGYIAVGTFTHHLTLGGILMLGLLIALSCSLFKPSNQKSYLITVGAVLLSIGLFVSYSRSAIIGLVAGLSIFVYYGDKKLKKAVIIFSIVSGLILLVIVPGSAQRFINSISNGEHSEGPRIRLWLTAVEIIKHHPWLGMGQGNFDLGFDKYHIPGFYHNHAHPHNDFLSVAVDGGLISLGAFLVMWAMYLLKMKKLAGKSRQNSHRWIPIMGASTVIAILIAGNFQNYQSDAEVGSMLWFIVGLSMAYEQLVHRQEQA